ncbi:unnamed protein product [Linum tenue]|uniref:Uncharacterized protein n=1 Tax=Linum tenue TaxID=586396 RepID=A0AAV0LAZ3_9ROSI|nr:unnamed protein product [Linum tenue]
METLAAMFPFILYFISFLSCQTEDQSSSLIFPKKMIISFSVSIRSISFPFLPLIFYFFPYLIFFQETEQRPKNSSDDAPDSPQTDNFGWMRSEGKGYSPAAEEVHHCRERRRELR